MEDVVITNEYIEVLLRADLATYCLTSDRAAMRAALGDAAAMCDMMAKAVIAQNSRGRRTIKGAREMASAFGRCGDEIWRMRDTIDVPAQGPDNGPDHTRQDP